MAAGTDDSLPLRVLMSSPLPPPRPPRPPVVSSGYLALRYTLAFLPSLIPVLAWSGLVCPRLAPPRRARPLINGPAHFAGMNGAKNYALLNTDELRNRRWRLLRSGFLVSRFSANLSGSCARS
jgi:hypothetical protein